LFQIKIKDATVYTAETLHKRSDINMASVFIVNIFFFFEKIPVYSLVVY